jgi:hypothetical protein
MKLTSWIEPALQFAIGLMFQRVAQSPLKPAGSFGPGRPILKQKPPSMPGHYRWYNSDGRMDYYGTTNNLARRYREHANNFPDATFVYKIAKEGATAAQLYAAEAKKIKRHKPSRNGNGGGGGRRWIAKAEGKS